MNGLNLPTDNLYKFIALAGLALMMLSVYLDYTKGIDISLAVEQLKGDLEVDKAESRYLQTQILEAIDKSNSLAVRQLTREADKQRAVVDAKLATVTFQVKAYASLSKVLTSTFFAGIGISIFGFLLWYVRVQRHLDAALRLESKIKKSK